MGAGITASEWLTFVINVGLPIIVAAVTSRFADGAVKAVTLLGLSALAGLLINVLDAVNAGTPVDWSHVLFVAGTGYVVAVAAHFGLWKPAAVTGSNGRVARVIPGGFGRPTRQRDDLRDVA